MVRGQPQEREKEVWWHRVKVWPTAVVSLSLLSACFILSCLVNRDNSVYTKIGKKLFKLQDHQEYHSRLTCFNEGKGLKDWHCCPTPWSPFQSSCYFISTELKNWTDSEKNCSEMGAHLMTISTKDEQQFINQKLDGNFAYYVGLSDPEGKHQWQWVDRSPYNESVSFWHHGEPNTHDERCVIINFRDENWGWNDASCGETQRSICEMTKIYL
ncbi:C-type lectin domain family 4 member C-like [Elephas maximus indicus]|uniref:C-type lectin domain family 4 member C-like n=1 Tax=Elephas maximus indicus TaxID=99487 RepID=UPI0021170D52|nr:C-type lectin domain family 4 member C-like [Elephas maximus indicus]